MIGLATISADESAQALAADEARGPAPPWPRPFPTRAAGASSRPGARASADRVHGIERVEGEERQAEERPAPARWRRRRAGCARNTGNDCARPRPDQQPRERPAAAATRATPITAIVQNQREPGSTVQPATSSASSVGATRLRRRLSRIFQRPMSGSGLRLRPRRDGTNGNSQNRICQSPRIQRCCRRACDSTLDG